MSGKYGSENECQSTEIGLNTGDQTGNVRADIYNIQNRLENINRRIRSSQRITLRNKELIWKFCEHCRLQGLSNLRVVFYLNRFWNIARLTNRNFDQMTKDDVQRLVIGLRELRKRNREPVSERTIVDHLVAIKTFWKWLKGTENEFPPEVKWIRANSRGTSLKLPDELPNSDDVQKLIDASTNARDKALIAVLYDSDCRIGELLTLRIRNLEFDGYGAVLHVNGKTGQRRVRIIHSVLRLQTWLEEHPLRGNQEAPVFCSLSNKNPKHLPLAPQYLNQMDGMTAEEMATAKARALQLYATWGGNTDYDSDYGVHDTLANLGAGVPLAMGDVSCTGDHAYQLKRYP